MPLQIPQRFQPQIQSALEKAVNSNDMDFLNRLQGGGIAGEMSYDAQMSMPGTLPYAQQARGNYTPTSLTAMSGIPIASDVAGLKMDYEMFRDEPESRTPLNFGLSALGALPFLPPLAGVGATVWHGSPHRWDKPDLSKIGTGEGAQAYGHGFYSAESQAVGQEYKDALGSKGLSAVDTPYLVDGEKVFPADVDYQQNYQAMMPGMDNFRDDRLKFLTEQAELSSNQSKQYKKMAIDSTNAEDIAHFNNMSDIFDSGYKKNNDLANDLQGMLSRGATVEPAGGHLYKLDIDDSVIGKMLDWDAPLSEQTQGVRDALRKGTNPEYDPFVNQPSMLEDIKGRGFASGFSDDMTMGAIYDNQIKHFGSKQATSEYLESLGIPGIKYWDGSSRLGGKGTRNFVNFNADDITAISRNGEPIRRNDLFK